MTAKIHRRNWDQVKKRRFYGRDSLFNRSRKKDSIFGRSMHYDRKGRAISLKRWAQMRHNDIRTKRVRATVVGEHWVSTVWLGLDHAYHMSPGQPTLIFETMIFDKEGPPKTEFDQWCDRYHSERDAIKGHNRVVDQLRKGTLS